MTQCCHRRGEEGHEHRATPTAQSRADDAVSKGIGSDESDDADNAELIPEIRRRLGTEQRSSGAERQHRPRRDRTLHQAAHRQYGDHDAGSYCRRRSTNDRDVHGKQDERRDTRRRRRKTNDLRTQRQGNGNETTCSPISKACAQGRPLRSARAPRELATCVSDQ